MAENKPALKAFYDALCAWPELPEELTARQPAARVLLRLADAADQEDSSLWLTWGLFIREYGLVEDVARGESFLGVANPTAPDALVLDVWIAVMDSCRPCTLQEPCVLHR